MSSVQAWENFAARVGKAIYELIRAAEVKAGSKFTNEQLVAIALLARTASNLKGVLVLLRHKLIVEARTLARSCFENQYWALALAEEGESFARKMIADDTFRKRQHGETMFQSQLKFEAELEANLRRWMRENRSRSSGGSLTPKQVANLGAAKRTYFLYGILSSDAHPSITSLNRYFGQDEKGEIANVQLEPEISEDDIADTLRLASLAVLGLCAGVDDMFAGTDAWKTIAEMGEEYKTLTRLKPDSEDD